MFGHDSLNYGNIHTLLHNAETRTFKAATLKPASWTGDYYEIRCTGGGAYRTAFLNSTGAMVGAHRGNASWADSDKIAAVVNSLPNGSYYVVKACRQNVPPPSSPPSSGNGNGNGNGDETPAGPCLDENREDATDETGCGECLSGYEEDDTGTCVAIVEDEEEDNTMRNLAIGGVVIGGIYAYFTYFRK